MGVRAAQPPFLTAEEQNLDLVDVLNEQLAAAEKRVRELHAENTQLRCDLDMADLAIDRLRRGLGR